MTAATEITRTRRRTRVTDSSLRAHVHQAANAGELRLPGRRVRLVSARQLLLYVIASLLVALPMAAISSVVHGPGDPVSAALSPDPRTPAQRAVAAAQRMVDLRPDLASYSRISYLRELHGDVAGAIEAMRLAIQAGAPTGEAAAWSDVQLGNLYLAIGDLDAAERAYERSLKRVDAYAHGHAGLARVRAARGELDAAATLYERATARLPLPEYVGALGDVYARLGDPAAAEREYALVDVERRLLIANGVRADVDLALFDADHGHDLARAVEVARAEYAIRPSVHIADILAWAELKSGDAVSALRHSTEALRLGSRDPLLVYHAGVIAQATGDDERARELLGRAHDLNPRFALLWADDLARRLDDLGPAPSAP